MTTKKATKRFYQVTWGENATMTMRSGEGIDLGPGYGVAFPEGSPFRDWGGDAVLRDEQRLADDGIARTLERAIALAREKLERYATTHERDAQSMRKRIDNLRALAKEAARG